MPQKTSFYLLHLTNNVSAVTIKYSRILLLMNTMTFDPYSGLTVRTVLKATSDQLHYEILVHISYFPCLQYVYFKGRLIIEHVVNQLN